MSTSFRQEVPRSLPDPYEFGGISAFAMGWRLERPGRPFSIPTAGQLFEKVVEDGVALEVCDDADLVAVGELFPVEVVG